MAARLRVKLIYSPLIRPRSEPRPPSPSRGKALSKRLLPSGEAAARRRLMRGGVASIAHLRGYCGNIGPHPASVGASATFPLAGEGSPQKAFPFGRSCRPQAADEGRLYVAARLRVKLIYSPLIRPAATFPLAGEGSFTILQNHNTQLRQITG